MEPVLNLSQQHNLFDTTAACPVTVIGAGAVGSHVVLALAKMGVPRITVYDGDYVESHNIPMSVYRPCDLARSKVDALRDIVEEASGVRIDARPKYLTDEALHDTVVCCVDSMEARQLVWRSVEMQPNTKLIDTRIAAELIWVFAIDPSDLDDIEFYQHHLSFTSKEAAHPMCGLHGIVYVSMRTAAAVCAELTTWWQHGRKKRLHKELAGELETLD